MPRFYVRTPPPSKGSWILPEEVAHHVSVLRLQVSEALILFCGDGYEYPAILKKITHPTISVDMGNPYLCSRESSLWIGLAQGLTNAENMEFILQKGVEMGVSAFQPLLTRRSMIKLSQERMLAKLVRWQSIIVASCEQCGRNIIPLIYPIQSLTAWVKHFNDLSATQLLLQPNSPAIGNINAPHKVWMMIGPEGGFDEIEQVVAQKEGWRSVGLGPRVLRTETAALSAVSAMQTLWGDYQSR